MEPIIFQPGPVTKGLLYADAKGDVYQAKRDIAQAKAQPKPGSYWMLISTAREAELNKIIISLQNRILELESIIRPKGNNPENLPEVSFDLNSFGVVCDGVTDNAVTLILMNNAVSFDYDHHYIFMVDPGTILSSWNQYLNNIYSFEFVVKDGGRVGLQMYDKYNPQTEHEGYQRPINMKSPFRFLEGPDPSFYPAFNAIAGSYLLEDVSNTDRMKPGQRIIIGCFDQIGNGFPPAWRFNEWNEVVSIMEGNVMLKKPVKYDYDPNLPEFSFEILEKGKKLGKPVIVFLDLIDYCYARYAKFTNVDFLRPKDGHHQSSGSVQVPANLAVFENCSNDGHFWAVSMCEEVIVNGHHAFSSNGVGAAELDKIVGKFTLTNSIMDINVSNGSSVEEIYIDNCWFNKGLGIGGLKKRIIHNSVIHTFGLHEVALSDTTGKYPCEYTELKNLEFIKDPGNLSDYAVSIDGFAKYKVTTDPDGSDIVIPYSEKESSDPIHVMIRSVTYGTELIAADGSNRGIVKSITSRSSDNATIIKGSWNPFPKGTELVWRYCQKVNNMGGHIIDPSFAGGLGLQTNLITIPPVEGNSEAIIDIYNHVKGISMTGKGFVYFINPYRKVLEGNIIGEVSTEFSEPFWISQLYAKATGSTTIELKLF